MRQTIAELFNSLQKAFGVINRLVNTADMLVETAEANTQSYRDLELNRLKQELLQLENDT